MKSLVTLGLALLFVTACSCDETNAPEDEVDASVLDAASLDAASDDAAQDDAAQDVAVPLECTQSLSLDGSNNATPTVIDFPVLGSEGATICFALDSTENVVSAHFAASTKSEMGPSSPFEMTLVDEDGILLREGWDVTVGETDPHTFTNLEQSFPIGQVTNVKLFVRLLETTPDAEINVSFFEPFE